MANGENTRAILGRLAEPSTWGGLSAILLAFGISIEAAEAVASVGAALAGAVAVILRERA